VLGPVLRHVSPTTATVWVETDGPAEVGVLGSAARTFRVDGHHYALVVVRDLAPGTSTPYTLRIDGDQVWPPADSSFPPSRIRTPSDDGEVRIVSGSCRYASPRALGAEDDMGADALDGLARRLADTDEDTWPHLLLLLGDQVYADELTAETKRRVAARRDIRSGPGAQVADFEEYTWLYDESWRDPEVRWLLSTVPTAMIFDDHDVHDDWNTSQSWREDAAREPWWAERIVGALQSYWVYQHLGNLSPDELDADPEYQALLRLAPDEDAEPLLRDLALRADEESDGVKGYRWSFRRDVGRTRVVVVDSRCGRLLEGDQRTMLSERDFSWLCEQVTGDFDHLVIGTSLPWLLAPALHDIEAWDERLAADRRPRRARFGEKLRRGADLEHWAAFGDSFRRFSDLIRDVALGRLGCPAPATVCVLSGDVHHSYVAAAQWHDQQRDEEDADRAEAAKVYQVTCSPLHNAVPRPMRLAFRLAWSRTAERSTRLLLGRFASVPRPHLHWHRTAGPFFGNAVATLRFDGRAAALTMETSEDVGDEGPLRRILAQDLTAT
jgi:hypothetical protein